MDFSAAIFRLLTCRLEVAEVANIRWNLKLRQHQITNHSNATHNRKYKASTHPYKIYGQDQKHQKATMLMLSFIKRPQEVPRNRSNYVGGTAHGTFYCCYAYTINFGYSRHVGSGMRCDYNRSVTPTGATAASTLLPCAVVQTLTRISTPLRLPGLLPNHAFFITLLITPSLPSLNDTAPGKGERENFPTAATGAEKSGFGSLEDCGERCGRL